MITPKQFLQIENWLFSHTGFRSSFFRGGYIYSARFWIGFRSGLGAKVIALLSGTKSQQMLGQRVAEQCMKFLFEDEKYDWYDTNCLQRLFLVLLDGKSPLITDEVIAKMNSRLEKSVCMDQSKWSGFAAQPLDSIDSPNSYWYKLMANAVKDNLDFWENTLLDEGYWPLNFSWGVDTEAARTSAMAWKGYTVVKRVKTLNAFQRIEK